MIVNSVERWVKINDKEVVAYLFRTDKDFYAGSAKRDFSEHPSCKTVEKAVFDKTQQECKLYRINRMEYVGHLLSRKGA